MHGCQAPGPGADRRFAAGDKFSNVKSLSDPLSPNVEDTSSERFGVKRG